MHIIDKELLDAVSAQARGNPRLRQNYNLHASDYAPCHRFLNAIEPGSYIRPHRHLDPAKDESIVILRGRLGVATFDEKGGVLRKTVIAAGGDALAVDIPHGTFHAAVSLASGTVFFEAKAGPYLPLVEEEKATWSPGEGSPEAGAWLTWLEGLF